MTRLLVSFFLCLLTASAVGQQIQITLGPDEIAENQAWTITITVQNERLKSYDNAPDIEGFRKRGTSTQSSTSIINGQVSSSQSVIMNYTPTKQGIITIPSFSMKVNDQVFNVQGKRVKVGPPAQRQQNDPYKSMFDRSPFDDFFGREEPEFVDVKEDAFLALTPSKDEVYVGEGFNVTLAFYVGDNNKAALQFHDISNQLTAILKRIKPANCWEENFNIENIEGNRVTINGKAYTQYKVYQATFYPFNTEPIKFPSVGLQMIKYKVAKNPTFFGQNRKEDFKTFNSTPKTIRVKELPPHPLKNQVAVGNYKLDEKIASQQLTTGQSTAYEFNVYGEGNIAAIEKPIVRNDGSFEFYDPNVRQDISRASGRVAGTKSFKYFVIPKEPGDYRLGDYFRWVYFNPEKKRYDTLRSKMVVNVIGESKKNEVIESNGDGSFYDRISLVSNSLKPRERTGWHKWAFSLFLIVMVGTSVFLLFKKS